MLGALLDSMVLANSWRAESAAVYEYEEDNDMYVFEWAASEDFEKELFDDGSNPSLSRQSSMMSISYEETDGTGKIVQKSSMDQQIVAVSRRQYRAHVNAIGRLTKSLKTYENQFEH